MVIAVFTQDGCMQCDMLKEKFAEEGIRYTEHDAGLALNPNVPDYFQKNPEWRTNGTVPAMGLLQMENSLPIVVIDDEAHSYQEAITKVLKPKQAVNIPEVKCEEAACALAV